MSDFSIFKNRYFIKAVLQLDTSLHIGEGTSLEPVGTDLPIVKDYKGLPYIPGSSLKGIFRFNLERILRTIEDKKDLFSVKKMACDPLSNKCLTDEEVKKIKTELTQKGNFDEGTYLKEIWNNLCLACRIFGSQHFSSRIYFKDAFIKEDTFYKTEIRDGVAIDRDTGTAKPKMKYDYEVVPSGAEFEIDIILENMEDWEIGLISFGFEIWKEGNILIGGRTSAGLGYGKIKNMSIEKIERENLIEALLEPSKRIKVQKENLISSFKSKLGGQNA